ncbi:hypothetical protein FQN50_009900 [Emmonsiellopsis sp. PD_5]|nr:hypothetical protein FQN50_009900 [Emmonsiellopsis sp. PD_5]
MEPSSPPSSSSSTSTSTSSLAALSVSRLARLYNRERLLVNPFYWTSRHVELLQCSFEKPVLASSSLLPADSEPSYHIEGKTGAFLVQRVLKYYFDSRKPTIRRIFSFDESPFVICENLRIRYDKDNDKGIARHAWTLPCLVFYLKSPWNELSQPPSPVAAYIDHHHIAEMRAEKVPHPPLHGRRNRPFEALYDLKLKKLRPSDPFHDPYIVALMIGLACASQFAVQGHRAEEPARANTSFTV